MKPASEYGGAPITHEDGVEAKQFLVDEFGADKMVSAVELYSDMFPHMQNSDQLRLPGEPPVPNPILVHHIGDSKGQTKTVQRIMFRDRLEQDCKELIEGNSFALVSGLSYLGKRNTLSRGVLMNALIIDLDSVPVGAIRHLLHVMSDKLKGHPSFLPTPTYITYSGTGMHLYYVFEEPIPLYPNQKALAKKFKHELTRKIWMHRETTTLTTTQYQGVAQGFRAPGSVNGKYESQSEVVTVRSGGKVTIEYLRDSIRTAANFRSPDTNWDPYVSPKGPTGMTKEEAMEAFPDWNPDAKVKGVPQWTSHRSLYDWWLRMVMESRISFGHRYHSMYTTTAFAKKCGVSMHDLRKDIYGSLLPKLRLDTAPGDPPITVEDAQAALNVYSNPHIHRMSIGEIERLTGLEIPRRKRNGRSQSDHLKLARFMQEMNDPSGEWRWKGGRPMTKDAVVQGWQLENPNGTKAECSQETGISYTTVNQHWSGQSMNGYASKVVYWRANNMDGSMAQCVRETGLSRGTVRKYWSAIDEIE